jgi:hypothetical protein
MQWLEGASIQDKLGALFIYLNNGEPINAIMISKLLKHVYRETKEVCIFCLINENLLFFFLILKDEIKALSQQFMQQLGSNENGKFII